MGSDWDHDLAEARVSEAAESRRQRDQERFIEASDARFDDVVEQLGRRQAVTLWLDSGAQRTGRIESIGSHVITVRTSNGAVTILRRPALVGIESGETGVAGEGGTGKRVVVDHELDMVDILAEFCDRVTPVSLHLDGAVVRGIIASVGDDVVEVVTTEGRRVYLALRSVTEAIVESFPSVG